MISLSACKHILLVFENLVLETYMQRLNANDVNS